ncbi:MAG: YdeI/OmpD-associated family protein [bacterium]
MDTAETHKDLPVLTFATVDQWEEWLAASHTQTTGVWIKFAKKASGHTTVTYIEARDTALMYGWVDGLVNAYDEKFYVTRFMSRRPKSTWSKINKGVAEQLIKEGKMQPAGLKEVERAKADGRWDAAYDPQSSMEVSDEFSQALDKNPAAAEQFAAISKANRYAFLYRLHHAKRAETKVSLIERFVEMLAAGETFH